MCLNVVHHMVFFTLATIACHDSLPPTQAPRKLATPVSFPLDAPLDMRPFLSSAVLRRRCGLRANGSSKQEAGAKSKSGTPLKLFAQSMLDTRTFVCNSLCCVCGQLYLGPVPSEGACLSAAAPGDAAAEAEPAPDAAEAAAAAQYRAYAVVCHHGNMQGGHYTAYVR